MFKLQNKTILISRTESGILQVKRKQGTMEEFAGTINELKIYHKEGLTEKPIAIISGHINTEDKNLLEFDLGAFTNKSENEIEFSNEPVEYWYELKINDKIVLGYDETKAKILWLYPAGKE
jgi:hypothetical protein